jgi:AraC-like DNA-binding protein
MLIEEHRNSSAPAGDPTGPAASGARMIQGARAAVVLTRAGCVLPVPGLPGHPLLDEGSTALRVAAGHLADGAPFTSFLCPRTQDDVPGHLRVTALACPQRSGAVPSAIVALSPATRLWGLLPLELDVLGMLVEGVPDAGIGIPLGLSERAVASCLDSVQRKLGASSRLGATLRAVRLGTYVPRPLLEQRHRMALPSVPRLRGRTPTSDPVSRVVQAIANRPGRAYALAELAEIANLSERRLQHEFQRRLGTSPKRYLQRVRLALVHDDLREADAGSATVTAIASRRGFRHLGRFAAAYRAAYGMAPSETLRHPG